jgi:hypothetical protein
VNFSDALRQAIDYRDSVFDDRRVLPFNKSKMNCCVVFPDWDGLHEDGTERYRREAWGMKVLAQRFQVGVLSRTQSRGSCSFVLGNIGVWHSKTGWTPNAKGLLEGKRRRGSGTKRFDEVV